MHDASECRLRFDTWQGHLSVAPGRALCGSEKPFKAVGDCPECNHIAHAATAHKPALGAFATGIRRLRKRLAVLAEQEAQAAQ